MLFVTSRPVTCFSSLWGKSDELARWYATYSSACWSHFLTLTVCSKVTQRILWNATGMGFGESSVRTGAMLWTLNYWWKDLNFSEKAKCSSTSGAIVQLGLCDYPHMFLHCGQRRGRMPGMNNWSVSFIDFPWKRKVKRELLEAPLNSLFSIQILRRRGLSMGNKFTE